MTEQHLTIDLDDVVLGRTDDGLIFKLNLQLIQLHGDRRTTEHETVVDPFGLAISASLWRPRARDCDMAGQVVDYALNISRLERGLTVGDVADIVDLWRKWHLNHITAGCVHTGLRRNLTDVPVNQWPACEETGYRYGSSWLVNVMPSDVIARIRMLSDKLLASTTVSA